MRLPCSQRAKIVRHLLQAGPRPLALGGGSGSAPSLAWLVYLHVTVKASANIGNLIHPRSQAIVCIRFGCFAVWSSPHCPTPQGQAAWQRHLQR
jgi:hypothetical protein